MMIRDYLRTIFPVDEVEYWVWTGRALDRSIGRRHGLSVVRLRCWTSPFRIDLTVSWGQRWKRHGRLSSEPRFDIFDIFVDVRLHGRRARRRLLTELIIRRRGEGTVVESSFVLNRLLFAGIRRVRRRRLWSHRRIHGSAPSSGLVLIGILHVSIRFRSMRLFVWAKWWQDEVHSTNLRRPFRSAEFVLSFLEEKKRTDGKLSLQLSKISRCRLRELTSTCSLGDEDEREDSRISGEMRNLSQMTEVFSGDILHYLWQITTMPGLRQLQCAVCLASPLLLLR